MQLFPFQKERKQRPFPFEKEAYRFFIQICFFSGLLIVLNVALGKHVIRQGFQLSERHVLHGVLYLANQLVSLEIVVIAQARCKSIAHFFTLNFEC